MAPPPPPDEGLSDGLTQCVIFLAELGIVDPGPPAATSRLCAWLKQLASCGTSAAIVALRALRLLRISMLTADPCANPAFPGRTPPREQLTPEQIAATARLMAGYERRGLPTAPCWSAAATGAGAAPVSLDSGDMRLTPLM